MKIAIVSLLSVLLMGAAIVPAASSGMPEDNTSTSSSAITSENAPATEAELPPATPESLPESNTPSETTPESAADSVAETPESEGLSPESGSMDSSAMPPIDAPGFDTSSEPEALDEPEDIVISEEYRLLLATNQADSMMGYYDMARNPACGSAAAEFKIEDFAADTEDEAYFILWEAMNATFSSLAQQGHLSANCQYADGMITICV